MTLPFYKLQLAGNGFILVDSGIHETLNDTQILRKTARALCDRRYGVGASGAIFLWPDNKIRIFSARGEDMHQADDALLCAARYAFDSGRAKNRMISFSTPRGERSLDVLGAHEFRLALGAPFSVPGGMVINPETPRPLETLEIDGIGTGLSAIHVREDTIIAFPSAGAEISWETCTSLVQRAFPGQRIQVVIAHAITSETLSIRTIPLPESGSCAAAAASLAAAACAGMSGTEAMVLFTGKGLEGSADEVIAKDRDNSRRLAIHWDTKANELYAIGSGGYLFEGQFDLED